MKPIYIQRRDSRYLETVDEINNDANEYPSCRDQRREAVRLVREYRFADPSASYYLSSRPCKDWTA